MQSINFRFQFKHAPSNLLLAAFIIFYAMGVNAALTSELADKVETYKKKLAEWAADPIIVNAVKEANAKGGIPGMNNAKWEELSENDPQVTALLNNEAAKLTKKLERENERLVKLYVRARDGHLIAGSNKPLIYNVSSRPTYKNAIGGQPWAADEVKADPAMQIKSVQLSVPIMNDGKVIGILHTAVKE